MSSAELVQRLVQVNPQQALEKRRMAALWTQSCITGVSPLLRILYKIIIVYLRKGLHLGANPLHLPVLKQVLEAG